MDRGAWQAAAHGVPKSRVTNTHSLTHTHTHTHNLLSGNMLSGTGRNTMSSLLQPQLHHFLLEPDTLALELSRWSLFIPSVTHLYFYQLLWIRQGAW